MSKWIPDSAKCLRAGAFIEYSYLDSESSAMDNAAYANADRMVRDVISTLVNECTSIDKNTAPDFGYIIRTDAYILSPTELSTMIEDAYRQGQIEAWTEECFKNGLKARGNYYRDW